MGRGLKGGGVVDFFSSVSKALILPGENKDEVKIELRDVYEIPRYADNLRAVLRRYLNPTGGDSR